MKKLVLFVESGLCTKMATAYLVPDTITQEELDDYAWLQAIEHAESYDKYLLCDAPEGEEDSGDYTDDIEGWWEEYNSDEHDGQLIYGCSDTFEWVEYQ